MAFNLLSQATVARSFKKVAVVTGVLFIVLAVLNHRLQLPISPFGIVSYQFAGTAARAQAIVTAWHSAQVFSTALQLQYLDCVFLGVYPVCLAWACRLLAPVGQPHTAGGNLVPWFALAAGPFDGVENLLQIIMLKVGATDALALWSMRAASLKFICIGVAGSYLLRVGIHRLRSR